MAIDSRYENIAIVNITRDHNLSFLASGTFGPLEQGVYTMEFYDLIHVAIEESQKTLDVKTINILSSLPNRTSSGGIMSSSSNLYSANCTTGTPETDKKSPNGGSDHTGLI